MSSKASSVHGASKRLSTGSVSMWETINSSGRMDILHTTSPYLQEIEANAAKKVQRQESRRSSFAQTLSRRPRDASHVRDYGRAVSRFKPGNHSNGGSTVSAVSMSDEQDAGFHPATDPTVEYSYALRDVAVQVRPAIREATTPADGKTMEELLETAKVENAQLLDETFRMRRQMEDLRFQLAEAIHEKEVLEEDLNGSVASLVPSAYADTHRISTQDQSAQTDFPYFLQPEESIKENHGRSTQSLFSSSLSLLENEEPRFPAFNEFDLDNEQEKVEAEPCPEDLANKTAMVRAVFEGHLERVRFLKAARGERLKNSIELIQSLVRGHMQRKHFLNLNTTSKLS